MVSKRRTWWHQPSRGASTQCFAAWCTCQQHKCARDGKGGETTRAASNHEGHSRRGRAYKQDIDKLHAELVKQAAKHDDSPSPTQRFHTTARGGEEGGWGGGKGGKVIE
jgi:hypothetical protein